MGYKEEIFERAEMRFGDIESAQSWLLGFDKPGKNSYEKAGFELGKDVANYVEVKDRVDRTKEYIELQDLRSLADGITFKPLKQKILPIVDKKIDSLSKELEELTEQRREERLEEERKEKQKERLLSDKEEYEIIREETDDPRKRENAKRNLEKINRRLEELG